MSDESTLFRRELYTHNIYDAAENPYTSWLEVTTEKRILEDWLRMHLPRLHLSGIRHRSVTVLDMGCSWGSTSLRLLRVLRDLGLSVQYTGVDPYEEQLERFAYEASALGMSVPRLLIGDADTFTATEVYDLVFVSHALYYLRTDMREVLQKLVRAAREAIFVHHGSQGIHTLHQAFPHVVTPGRYLISTDKDIARAFTKVDLAGRALTPYHFTSTADISACMDPVSQRGQNLLAFFYEREYETIPPEELARIRSFLHKTYAPSFLMPHDDCIFVVR